MPWQSPIRAAFILQNEMRRLPGRKRLQPLAQDHAESLLVIDRERFAAPRAKPEVFDVMTIRGSRVLPGNLLKAEKTSLTVIKIGRAFRMGAFQIHDLCVAASLMGSHTQLNRKIRP